MRLMSGYRLLVDIPISGSSADDLWKELGIHENITATAIKSTIAIQIESEKSSQNRVGRSGQ